jgi:hypothetical protein
LPAAAFQAAFCPELRVFWLSECRLKAGCSHDWLPHILQNLSVAKNYVALGYPSCPPGD